MPKQLQVMISSTARDLPEHRKEVMDACLRQGMFPIMMEHLLQAMTKPFPHRSGWLMKPIFIC